MQQQLQTSDRNMRATRQDKATAKEIVAELRQVLASYLSDGYLEIETAAEIIGMSVRSLQRRLKNEGLTYSHLIDDIRFRAAIPLLNNEQVKLIDVAYELGYSEPAHFTRAFRRWSGVSPRQFRDQQLHAG